MLGSSSFVEIYRLVRFITCSDDNFKHLVKSLATNKNMSTNTIFVWALVGFLFLLDAIWLPAEDMALAPSVILPTLLPIIGTGILSYIYTYWRPDRRIATLTFMISVTFAFTAVTMVLSYIMVGLKQPLIDGYLIDIDHALSFDWPKIYNSVAAYPLVHMALKIIYLSLVPQMIILQLYFNFREQFERAWELQWLFFLICLGCILFSGLWPAAGAFGAFQTQLSEPYVQEFMKLRDGSLKLIGVGGVQGVIQFPSLHTALAILYIYMTRNDRKLFLIFFILNCLVIIATPAIGGHHFADLWGGAALALGLIFLCRRFQKNLVENRSAGP